MRIPSSFSKYSLVVFPEKFVVWINLTMDICCLQKLERQYAIFLFGILQIEVFTLKRFIFICLRQ